MEKTDHPERAWISLILRVAMAALFTAAVVPKFQRGLESIVVLFQGAFKDSWLPMPLVTLHARLVPWIELLLPLWLVAGWKLRWAWVTAALFMTTLAFGMLVTEKGGSVAAANFNYMLICCVGLYFSRYDRFGLDGFSRSK